MTIVVDANEKTFEQIKKQLNKLIDVIRVYDLTKKDYIDRELILIRVDITPKTREKVIQAVDSVSAEIVAMGKDSVTIEEAGDTEKVNALLELLRPFGIKDIVRTGRIAMAAEGKKEE